MARRSTRKRKPPDLLKATPVRATGRRITKKKLSVQDLTTWEQVNTIRHGNSRGERAIRVEIKKRISPLIEETLRQRDIAKKSKLEAHRLKRQMKLKSVALDLALNRNNDLANKFRSCRRKLVETSKEIEQVRKDLDYATFKLKNVDSARDRVARKLLSNAKANEEEKACLFYLSSQSLFIHYLFVVTHQARLLRAKNYFENSFLLKEQAIEHQRLLLKRMRR